MLIVMAIALTIALTHGSDPPKDATQRVYLTARAQSCEARSHNQLTQKPVPASPRTANNLCPHNMSPTIRTPTYDTHHTIPQLCQSRTTHITLPHTPRSHMMSPPGYTPHEMPPILCHTNAARTIPQGEITLFPSQHMAKSLNKNTPQAYPSIEIGHIHGDIIAKTDAKDQVNPERLSHPPCTSAPLPATNKAYFLGKKRSGNNEGTRTTPDMAGGGASLREPD